MPVTLPAGIIALQGQSSTTAPIVLMEWLLPSPQYYSSREAVTWLGHTWEGNRLLDFPSFTLGIFDRKGREFPKLAIRLSNLANDGSSAFPMQALDAAHELENYPIKIYFYSPEAATGFLRWSGYSGRPTYNGADKSVSLSATFIFDSLNLPYPFRTQGDLGFSQLDTNSSSSSEEPLIPIIYGDGPDLAVRPTIFRSWSEPGLLNVNFILTACNDGFPLDAAVITEAKLNGSTPALEIEMGGLGSSGQAAPANLSRFPDGEAHPRVAFGYASFSFPNPDNLKDALENLEPDAIKMWLANGRPLATTGEPSENHVLIIKDLLTDSYFGLGLAESEFDAASALEAENYVGTRYRARLELHEGQPLMDLLQRLLGDCHCYLTFADKIQIRAKGNAEASVATFATSDSGEAGRTIVNNFIESVSEEDQGTVLNDILLTYRKKNRHFGAPIHLYDPNAQLFTPGNVNKPVREEIESLSLQYEDETKISGAILVREELNGNLFHGFTVPFWDGCDVVPGDLITVHSVDIFGAASNYLFRVLTQSFDPNGAHISFKCKVYKPAIYNDDADGIGVDLLRGGRDTSQQGRPPDVVPVSIEVIDTEANDTSGTLLTFRATATIPAHDPAPEQAQGVFREPPIAGWGAWWRYTNEPVTQARHGATIEVQQSTSAFDSSLEFKVDFHKNRTVEVFFVALPPSRSRSPLGYIRDTTRVSSLTAALTAVASTATVASETVFSVDDYVIVEKEFLKVASKAPLTFVNSGGVRTAQLDSVSISHPIGIEVAVARKSYSSLTLLLIKRNTFLNVTGFTADQEDDGVRFHWDDLQVDNLDYYLIYECQDADALTNPAKLGSASPTWFTTNPEAPPASVSVHRTKHKHYKVPSSEIAAGVKVAGRGAAKNIKGNYSSVLSNSATNNSTGHGVVPLFVPSDPATGDIISLGVPSEIAHKQIPVTMRIWAKGTDHAQNFDDGGIDRVGFFYAPPTAADSSLPDLTRIEKVHQNITDTTAVSATLTKWFPIGQKLFWLGNYNANGSGKTLSANQAANVVFVPGDYNNDPGNLATFAIAATAINDKFTRLDVHIVQPAAGSPVILKNLWFDRQLPSESYVELSDKLIHLHGDTSFSQLGADFHLFAEVKHPSGLTGINYRARIVAQGGLSRSVSTSANSATDPDVPIDTGVVPGTPGAPTFARVKKTGTPVRTPLPPTATNRASHSHNLLVIANAAAPANGVKVLTASDLSTGTVLSSADDTAGRIEMGRKKTTVDVDKTGMEEIFGVGVTIYFWFYWINDFGAGARSAALAYNLATGEAGAVSTDTAVPTLATNPDTGTTGPTVQERHAKIDVTCKKPSANIFTLDNYQVILSTQNTAPADPTVGIDGVVKIKEGQHVTFNLNYFLDQVSGDVWAYFRAHNKFSTGWSVWSAGTNQHGYSRPIDELMGTGVPIHAMGLDRSGTGAAVSNTTTTYQLDAGASAVANYYVGKAVHIPGMAAAADRVRTIAGYNNSTKVITVGTAWSVAPGSAVNFELHYGQTLAEKSGTGHTTTVIQLTTAVVASALVGSSIYMPSAAAGDQIRRIISNTTTAVTIEVVMGVALPNNGCYIIASGSFGWVVVDRTGIVTPVPARSYYDGDANQGVLEMILPTGENAYSLSDGEVQRWKFATAVLKDSQKISLTGSPVYRYPPPTNLPVLTFYVRNGYRLNGSTGKSGNTYYVDGYLSSGGTVTGYGGYSSASSPNTYDPTTFVPPDGDPLAQANKPLSLWSAY